MERYDLYKVITFHEHTAVSIVVTSVDEQSAIEKAVAIMADEWGQGIHDYIHVTVEQVDNAIID